MSSAEQTRSLYRRTLNDPVAIRRYTGTGANRPFFDTPCRAQVTGDRPDVLIGTVNQYDYTAIVFVQDLIDGQFALPITSNDRLIFKGKELAIMFPDNATRSVDGELIAYVLRLKG